VRLGTKVPSSAGHAACGSGCSRPGQLAIVAPYPFIVWGADEMRRMLVRRRKDAGPLVPHLR
jgi:hypothetical protein